MQSNTAEKLEVYEVPAGGIGDFVMSDEHLEHFEKEDAKKILGSKGIASYEKIAANMASMGRFGDDSVAHLETGEIIVPRALVERNPELKESIFKNLREAGIDNPERYVVGSSQNSINPDTGLPEFFLKKLVRGIKKVFKAVKKVAKVVVPIIASVLLTPIVGPVAAGAITGGISTLAQGGNLKDALKSAALGGALGGVAAKLQGGDIFGKQGALTNPRAYAQAQGTALASQTPVSELSVTPDKLGVGATAGDIATAAQNVPLTAQNAAEIASSLQPAGLTVGDVYKEAIEKGLDPDLTILQDGQLAQGPFSPEVLGRDSITSLDQTARDLAQRGTFDFDQKGGLAQTLDTSDITDISTPDLTPKAVQNIVNNVPQAETGFFDKALTKTKDFFMPDVQGKFSVENISQKMFGKPYASLKAAETQKVIELAGKGPGVLDYAKSYALPATVLAAGTGVLRTPELELNDGIMRDEDGDIITGADLLAQNPEKYMIDISRPVGGPYDIPAPRIAGKAEGGGVFPRRVGGIMPDEGVPDEDSVKAMLMPGEFVMTTQAVKGLGNGNNRQGIKNMYKVMRNLERRAEATA